MIIYNQNINIKEKRDQLDPIIRINFKTKSEFQMQTPTHSETRLKNQIITLIRE